jgi:hypothetical protein
MVKAITDAKRMLGANLDAQIEASKPLLAVAHERRAAGVLLHRPLRRRRSARCRHLVQAEGCVTLAADTDGHEIDTRLDFRKSDSLPLKKYASCFFGTDLVPRLMSRGVDTYRLHDQRLRARDGRRCGAECIGVVSLLNEPFRIADAFRGNPEGTEGHCPSLGDFAKRGNAQHIRSAPVAPSAYRSNLRKKPHAPADRSHVSHKADIHRLDRAHRLWPAESTIAGFLGRARTILNRNPEPEGRSNAKDDKGSAGADARPRVHN